MKKHFFLWVIFGCIFILNAQSVDTSEHIKFQIQELSKKNDIKAINRLLNTNTYLDPEFTLKVIQNNLEKSLSEKAKENLADTYLTLGNFWYTQGNQTKAFDNYLKSENLAKEIYDYRIQGLALMNRSHIPEDLNQKIRMLKEAVEMLTEVQDTLNLAKANLNLGNNYSLFVLNDKNSTGLLPSSAVPKYRSEAFKHYEIAQNLNKNIKNPEIEASVNVHYGEWYRFEKNYEKARNSFRKAEEFFVQAGRIKGKVYSLHQLALIEKETGNPQNALTLLQEAEEISKKFDYIDYQVETYSQFLEIYKLLENHDQVLIYYDLFHEAALHLSDINSRDKIHRINLEHNLSESEYLLEKAENQKKHIPHFDGRFTHFNCIGFRRFLSDYSK